MPTNAQHRVLGKIPSIIYALIDPFTGDVRYIGKTTSSLQSRWSSHVKATKNLTNEHKTNWIKSCIAQGTYPYIEQIDSGLWDLDTVNQRESYWISYYSSRVKLTNKTTGGDGSPCLLVSEETRNKLSEAGKRRYSVPENIESSRLAHRSYWHDNTRAREAVSRQTKARWDDPTYKARVTFSSMEYREKRSVIAKEVSSRPEVLEARSNAGIKSMALKRQCGECGTIKSPAHLGSHQRHTGHSGYTNLGVGE